MKPKEKALRKRLSSDFPYYAKKNLKIRTKSGKVEPFVLNSAQQYIHEKLEEQLSLKGMIRAILLKGRQQGVSTYTEGRFYWKGSHKFGVNIFILTHEEEATKNLFNMAKHYHENCNQLLKPETGAANGRELIFSELNSRYKVGTAGNKSVGRSGTTQFFHGSEAGFWPHAEEHLAGVMQTVPRAPGTEIIIESTANGVGGVFYEMCMEAMLGEGDYILIFVPWYWQQEYRIEVGKDFNRTSAEAEYCEKARMFTAQYYGTPYELDDAQLMWRRNKTLELKSSDLFNQEYPVDIDSAFIFSGRSVFEHDWLNQIEPKPPLFLAEINTADLSLNKSEDGGLKVWESPKQGARYVIGADIAEGLATGDYSSADVLKLPGGEQVAQWHGKTAPDLFGHTLAALGRIYNNAEIGPERNNHGLTTITTLADLDYPFIYRAKSLEGGEGKLGWSTTASSKKAMIDQLITQVRDGDHGIICAESIEEMRTYIEEDGKLNAKSGCFDDRVISRAIAGMMMKETDAHTSAIYAASFNEDLHVKNLDVLPRAMILVGISTIGEPAAVICQLRSDGQIRALKELASWDKGMSLELFVRGLLRVALKKYPKMPMKLYATPSKGKRQSAESNAMRVITNAKFDVRGAVSDEPGRLRTQVTKHLSELVNGQPRLVIDTGCSRLIEAIQGRHRMDRFGDVEVNKWLPIMRSLEFVVVESEEKHRLDALLG